MKNVCKIKNFDINGTKCDSKLSGNLFLVENYWLGCKMWPKTQNFNDPMK